MSDPFRKAVGHSQTTLGSRCATVHVEALPGLSPSEVRTFVTVLLSTSAAALDVPAESLAAEIVALAAFRGMGTTLDRLSFSSGDRS